MRLMIIWGSSRQGRRGGPVAEWVKQKAEADQRFAVDFVDLRELELPFFDEPVSPFSMKDEGADYTNPKGKAWARRVAEIDALILITPEYNHAPPAVLKNALDWVGPEWVDKPVGLISYGSSAGGARAIEQLRSITIELGLINVANPIHFVGFRRTFEAGEEPNERSGEKLAKMFDELVRLRMAISSASA